MCNGYDVSSRLPGHPSVNNPCWFSIDAVYSPGRLMCFEAPPPNSVPIYYPHRPAPKTLIGDHLSTACFHPLPLSIPLLGYVPALPAILFFFAALWFSRDCRGVGIPG